jgi:hypothetical protein
MDLIVAIKSEPSRVVKKTAKNSITILLSPNLKVADPTLLHRDNAYLDKLEGTCFKCSKLSEIPPVEVCEPPPPPPPPPGSCLENNPNNYCACFRCPPPPGGPYCCLCAFTSNFLLGSTDDGQNYPSANSIESAGSGYWVGLQANNFYSDPLNGGWVVAVECGTGLIVGAFPVSTNNFGYGVGKILGYSVMIYPAAVVYGAGFRPFGRTSFPILAQNTADGDALINTDFQMSGPDMALGTPYNEINKGGLEPSSTFNYFCNTGPAQIIDPLNPELGIVQTNKPQSCLQKYGDNSCPEFNSIVSQPNPFGTEFLMDMRNAFKKNGPSIFDGGVFNFSTANGNYCSVVDGIEQFENYGYDALFGICSDLNPIWPDPPEDYHPDCNECVTNNIDVPCQYVNNLTMGSFNFTRGGYSAASEGDTSYFAIGPANPPSVSGNTLSNTSFWENYWNWDPNNHYIEFQDSSGNPSLALLPPIAGLLDSCNCSDSEYTNYGILFIENYGDDCDGVECGKRTSVSAMTIKKSGSACVPYCRSCPRNDMIDRSALNGPIIGKAGAYGRLKCCESKNPFDVENNFTNTVNETLGSTIWWVQSFGSGQSELGSPSLTSPIKILVSGPPSVPPSVLSCLNGIPISSSVEDKQSDPCSEIFKANQSGDYEFNLQNFLDCTGYDDFNSVCFKSKYLPLGLYDTQLELNPNPSTNYFTDGVGYFQNGQFISIKDHICPGGGSCSELKYLNGPGYSPSGTSIGEKAVCRFPVEKTQEVACSDGTTETRKEIEFIKAFCDAGTHGPEYCNQANLDPCGCCSPSGVQDGGNGVKIGCTTSESNQQGCPECCTSGDGCQDNSACPGGPPGG